MLDANGNPIAGAPVQLTSESNEYSEVKETDENGEAEFIAPPSDDLEGSYEHNGEEHVIENPREGGVIEVRDGESEGNDDVRENDESENLDGVDEEPYKEPVRETSEEPVREPIRD